MTAIGFSTSRSARTCSATSFKRANQTLPRFDACSRTRSTCGSEVLVVVDHADGEVKKPTYELLTVARLGESAAVFFGSPDKGDAVAEKVERYGAAKVYVVDDAQICRRKRRRFVARPLSRGFLTRLSRESTEAAMTSVGPLSATSIRSHRMRKFVSFAVARSRPRHGRVLLR